MCIHNGFYIFDSFLYFLPEFWPMDQFNRENLFSEIIFVYLQRKCGDLEVNPNSRAGLPGYSYGHECNNLDNTLTSKNNFWA